MAKMYFIDAIDSLHSGEIIITDYKQIKALLKCDLFTITTRNIGGQTVHIYCDDMGLSKDDLPWGAISIVPMGGLNWCKEELKGNLLIASRKVDYEGDELDLTDEEVEAIQSKFTPKGKNRAYHDRVVLD